MKPKNIGIMLSNKKTINILMYIINVNKIENIRFEIITLGNSQKLGDLKNQFHY